VLRGYQYGAQAEFLVILAMKIGVGLVCILHAQKNSLSSYDNFKLSSYILELITFSGTWDSLEDILLQLAGTMITEGRWFSAQDAGWARGCS